MIKCTRCGREIPEDSKFCPYCGLRLFEVDKTAYLTTSAILMFVSASMLLSGAIYGFWSSFRTAFAPFRYLGFASGLVAGILATGKRNFIATIILNLMLIAFSIITINEWLPEITPLALSILSLIFLSLSKSEFERWGERKPTLAQLRLQKIASLLILLFLLYLTVFSLVGFHAFLIWLEADPYVEGPMVWKYHENDWQLLFLDGFSKIFGETLTAALTKFALLLTFIFWAPITLPIYWIIGTFLMLKMWNNQASKTNHPAKSAPDERNVSHS